MRRLRSLCDECVWGGETGYVSRKGLLRKLRHLGGIRWAGPEKPVDVVSMLVVPLRCCMGRMHVTVQECGAKAGQ